MVKRTRKNVYTYQILSGWPSPTDSEVNRKVFYRLVSTRWSTPGVRIVTFLPVGTVPLVPLLRVILSSSFASEGLATVSSVVTGAK